MREVFDMHIFGQQESFEFVSLKVTIVGMYQLVGAIISWKIGCRTVSNILFMKL
jgi:hypothetical protein